MDTRKINGIMLGGDERSPQVAMLIVDGKIEDIKLLGDEAKELVSSGKVTIEKMKFDAQRMLDEHADEILARGELQGAREAGATVH